ncbi:SpoIIE family protein phosphatase [Streptomyces sp. NBC_01445]|uniref:SpoIIE family protein phosphatase n=1 Tax=Streptomyces sp. NBC_01445 TaxID=2903869 RepID=UPI003FA3469A
MGNGLSAAVTMGRLRTAGRTLLDLEQPLDELFFHLNEIVSGLGDGFHATCLCIVYDPVSRMRQANTAGQLPPVILPPGGISYVLGLPVNSHLAPPLPLRYSRVQPAARHRPRPLYRRPRGIWMLDIGEGTSSPSTGTYGRTKQPEPSLRVDRRCSGSNSHLADEGPSPQPAMQTGRAAPGTPILPMRIESAR